MSSISLRYFRVLDGPPVTNASQWAFHVLKIIPPGAPRQVLVADDVPHKERTLIGDHDLFDQPITLAAQEVDNESERFGWTVWRRDDKAQPKVYLFDSTGFHGVHGGVSVAVNVDGLTKSQLGEDLSMTLIPSGKTQRAAQWKSTMHRQGNEGGRHDPDFIFEFDAKLGGLWGQYQAQIRDSDGHLLDVQGTATVEFYWLQVANLPTYFDKGIPLTFLRMFLLPAATHHANSLPTSKWVEMATKIVHGSCKPFSGEPCSTTGHWLKYEAGYGNSSFINTPRGTEAFDVVAWLDAWRVYTQHRKVTTVNCYDQAAALEVALTLGMPWRRIAWEYHVVYGFIPTTELVGWGPCNNPYFDYLSPKILDESDKTRNLFRNHAYLCWNEDGDISDSAIEDYYKKMKGVASTADYAKKASAFEQEKRMKLKMIDACAGPHIGNESREQYEHALTRVLPPYDKHENDNVRAWIEKKLPVDEEHYLGRGITSRGTRADNNIHHFGSTMGPIFAHWVEVVEKLLPKAERDDFVVNSCYTDLSRAMETAAREVHSNWSHLTFVPIRDLNTDNSTSTRELKFHYFKPGKSPDACFVSMRVTLSPMSSMARQRLADDLIMNALMNNNLKDTMRVCATAYLFPNKLNLIGAGGVRAFLFYNLAVRIEGPDLWSDDPDHWFGRIIMEPVMKLRRKERGIDWQDFWTD